MNMKQKRVHDKENNFVCSWVTKMIDCVRFHCTVISCNVGIGNTKQWKIVYDNGDKEEILVKLLGKCQSLYVKGQEHNIVGNQKQTAIQPLQLSQLLTQRSLYKVEEAKTTNRDS